ncbi:hypothetical protein BJ944DRAFT_236459 [Cunninghamella echinulata]|nr:hypothetical protein BJ944DRAFT_236459 [Cunninghamella echinulata]
MSINSLSPTTLKKSSDAEKLEIHLNSCFLDVKVSRPYVIITMGDQFFQTSISEYPDGKWNERFELKVTYHAQLFDTIQLDIYDSYMLLPDRHVGRAEIRLKQLYGMPESFTSYYEVWDKKLSTGASSHAVRKTTMATNVGAIQVKIAYSYQHIQSTLNDREPKLIKNSITDALMDETFRRHLQRDRDSSSINFRKYEEGIDDIPKDQQQQQQQQQSSDKDHASSAYSISPSLSTSSISLDQDSPDDSDSENMDDTATLAFSVQRANSTTTRRLSKSNTTTTIDSTTSTSSVPETTNPAMKKSTSNTSFNVFQSVTSWFSLENGTSNTLPPPPSQPQTMQPTNEKGVKMKFNSTTDVFSDLDDSLKTFPLLDTVGSWTVSKETNQVLRAIGKLLAAFGQGFELSPLQIVTGFQVVDKFYQELPRERTWDLVSDLSEIQLASHMWRFSMASYGWKGLNFIGKGNGYISDAVRDHSDAKSIMEYLSIPKDDLLAYEFRIGEAFRPSYYIARDRNTNSIVLAIRGTLSAFDTMTDLVCDYEPWKGGMVHKGMKASAMWFFRHLGPKLIAYSNAHSTTSLYIVGHSLGAATAAILTIMLLDYIDEFKKGKTEDFTIKSFGYAPACGLSLDLSEKYKDHIQSFVFADDVVSKLCYGTMMDVKEMIIAGSEAAQHLGLGQILWTDNKATESWKSAFKQVAECRERCLESMENPKLYVAGTVYQFWLDPTPKNETRIVIERTSAKRVSSELVLKKSIIFDHLPTNFNVAFLRATESLMMARKDNQPPPDGVLDETDHEPETLKDKVFNKISEHELKKTSDRGGGDGHEETLIDEKYTR